MESKLGLTRLSDLSERMNARAKEFADLSDEKQLESVARYLSDQDNTLLKAGDAVMELKRLLMQVATNTLGKVDDQETARLRRFYKKWRHKR